MPRRSGKERLARVHELYEFDKEIALSCVASGPACPVESYSTGVPDVSARGTSLAARVDPFTAQSSNHSITQLPNPPLLAGFDEAGRGALAGPVVVGCVHFPFFSAALQESVSSSSRDAPVAAELYPHPRRAVSEVALLGVSDNVADPSGVRLHGADKLLTLQRNVADELPRYEKRDSCSVAPLPDGQADRPRAVAAGQADRPRAVAAGQACAQRYDCDLDLNYENRAESSIGSEPCPHFGQAGSDVPVTDHSSPSTNPSISRSLNPSISRSPDSPITQSLNDSILESLSGLDDSKRLTARQREALFPRITAHGVWGIGIASAEEIDRLGIVPAVSLAARRAYLAMGAKVDLLLCDRGLTLLRDSEIQRLNHLTPQASEFQITQSYDPSSPQLPDLQITQSLNSPISRSLNPSITQSTELSFTRGDSRSLHIAAASIIAKVTRDQMMVDLDRDFPGYDFAKHKGYGTVAHIVALRKLGPSSIHRRTFHVK